MSRLDPKDIDPKDILPSPFRLQADDVVVTPRSEARALDFEEAVKHFGGTKNVFQQAEEAYRILESQKGGLKEVGIWSLTQMLNEEEGTLHQRAVAAQAVLSILRAASYAHPSDINLAVRYLREISDAIKALVGKLRLQDLDTAVQKSNSIAQDRAIQDITQLVLEYNLASLSLEEAGNRQELRFRDLNPPQLALAMSKATAYFESEKSLHYRVGPELRGPVRLLLKELYKLTPHVGVEEEGRKVTAGIHNLGQFEGSVTFIGFQWVKKGGSEYELLGFTITRDGSTTKVPRTAKAEELRPRTFEVLNELLLPEKSPLKQWLSSARSEVRAEARKSRADLGEMRRELKEYFSNRKFSAKEYASWIGITSKGAHYRLELLMSLKVLRMDAGDDKEKPYQLVRLDPETEQELDLVLSEYYYSAEQDKVQPQIERILNKNRIFHLPQKKPDYGLLVQKVKSQYPGLKNPHLGVVYGLMTEYFGLELFRPNVFASLAQNGPTSRMMRNFAREFQRLGLLETFERVGTSKNLWIRFKKLSRSQRKRVQSAIWKTTWERRPDRLASSVREAMEGKEVAAMNPPQPLSFFVQRELTGYSNQAFSFQELIEVVDGIERRQLREGATIPHVKIKHVCEALSEKRAKTISSSALLKTAIRRGVDLRRLGMDRNHWPSDLQEIVRLWDEADVRLRAGNPKFRWMPMGYLDLAWELAMGRVAFVQQINRKGIDVTKKGYFPFGRSSPERRKWAIRFLRDVLGDHFDSSKNPAAVRLAMGIRSARKQMRQEDAEKILAVQNEWRDGLQQRRRAQREAYLAYVAKRRALIRDLKQFSPKFFDGNTKIASELTKAVEPTTDVRPLRVLEIEPGRNRDFMNFIKLRGFEAETLTRTNGVSAIKLFSKDLRQRARQGKSSQIIYAPEGLSLMAGQGLQSVRMNRESVVETYAPLSEVLDQDGVVVLREFAFGRQQLKEQEAAALGLKPLATYESNSHLWKLYGKQSRPLSRPRRFEARMMRSQSQAGDRRNFAEQADYLELIRKLELAGQGGLGYFRRVISEMIRYLKDHKDLRGLRFLELGPGKRTQLLEFLRKEGIEVSGAGRHVPFHKPYLVQVDNYFKDFFSRAPKPKKRFHIIYSLLGVYPNGRGENKSGRLNKKQVLERFGPMVENLADNGLLIFEILEGESKLDENEIEELGLEKIKDRDVASSQIWRQILVYRKKTKTPPESFVRNPNVSLNLRSNLMPHPRSEARSLLNRVTGDMDTEFANRFYLNEDTEEIVYGPQTLRDLYGHLVDPSSEGSSDHLMGVHWDRTLNFLTWLLLVRAFMGAVKVNDENVTLDSLMTQYRNSWLNAPPNDPTAHLAVPKSLLIKAKKREEYYLLVLPLPFRYDREKVKAIVGGAFDFVPKEKVEGIAGFPPDLVSAIPFSKRPIHVVWDTSFQAQDTLLLAIPFGRKGARWIIGKVNAESAIVLSGIHTFQYADIADRTGTGPIFPENKMSVVRSEARLRLRQRTDPPDVVWRKGFVGQAMEGMQIVEHTLENLDQEPVLQAWQSGRGIGIDVSQNNVMNLLREHQVPVESIVIEHGPPVSAPPGTPISKLSSIRYSYPHRLLISPDFEEGVLDAIRMRRVKGSISQTAEILQTKLPDDWPGKVGAVVWYELLGFLKEPGKDFEVVLREALTTVHTVLPPGGVFVVVEGVQGYLDQVQQGVTQLGLPFAELHIYRPGPDYAGALVFKKSENPRSEARQADRSAGEAEGSARPPENGRVRPSAERAAEAREIDSLKVKRFESLNVPNPTNFLTFGTFKPLNSKSRSEVRAHPLQIKDAAAPPPTDLSASFDRHDEAMRRRMFEGWRIQVRNAVKAVNQDPKAMWVAAGGHVFKSDAESARLLDDWFEVKDFDPNLPFNVRERWGKASYSQHRRFPWEYRILNTINYHYLYPDSLLTLKARKIENGIHVVIEDETHPEVLHEEARWINPGATLKDSSREVRWVDLPFGRYDAAKHTANLAAANRSENLPAAEPRRPDFKQILESLYGPSLKRTIHLSRDGKNFEIEPQISFLNLAKDPAFADTFFDWTIQIAVHFYGMNIAMLGDEDREELNLWGFKNQVDLVLDTQDAWRAALQEHSHDLFAISQIPYKFVRDSRFRELILAMIKENFFDFKLDNSVEHEIIAGFSEGSRLYVWTLQEILGLFEKAREAKRDAEKAHSQSLRGYIYQGEPDLDWEDDRFQPREFFEGKMEFKADTLYLLLRDETGHFVDWQVLGKSEHESFRVGSSPFEEEYQGGYPTPALTFPNQPVLAILIFANQTKYKRPVNPQHILEEITKPLESRSVAALAEGTEQEARLPHSEVRSLTAERNPSPEKSFGALTAYDETSRTYRLKSLSAEIEKAAVTDTRGSRSRSEVRSARSGLSTPRDSPSAARSEARGKIPHKSQYETRIRIPLNASGKLRQIRDEVASLWMGPILFLLEKYFPEGFRGKRGLEIGFTEDGRILFDYLKQQLALMEAVGYKTQNDPDHGITQGSALQFLLETTGPLDFVYSFDTLVRDSDSRNSQEELQRIFKAIFDRLKNGGILIAVKQESERSLSDAEIRSFGYQIIGRGSYGRGDFDFLVLKKDVDKSSAHHLPSKLQGPVTVTHQNNQGDGQARLRSEARGGAEPRGKEKSGSAISTSSETLKIDPLLYGWGESLKKIVTQPEEILSQQMVLLFHQISREAPEGIFREHVRGVISEVDPYRNAALSGLHITALEVMRALGLYLLARSLEAQDGNHFPDPDLDYLQMLIEAYNREPRVRMPLDIPSLLYLSRSQVFQGPRGDEIFRDLSLQLAKLPPRFSRKAVALHHFMQASHLDGPEKSDTHYEFEITNEFLRFTFDELQKKDLGADEREALELGLYRLLMFLLPFVVSDFGRQNNDQHQMLVLRDEMPHELKQSIFTRFYENADLIDQIFKKFSPVELFLENSTFDVMSEDPSLSGLFWTYYVQAEPYLIEGLPKSKWTIEELFLHRTNPEAIRYLNQMVLSVIERQATLAEKIARGLKVHDLPVMYLRHARFKYGLITSALIPFLFQMKNGGLKDQKLEVTVDGHTGQKVRSELRRKDVDVREGVQALSLDNTNPRSEARMELLPKAIAFMRPYVTALNENTFIIDDAVRQALGRYFQTDYGVTASHIERLGYRGQERGQARWRFLDSLYQAKIEGNATASLLYQAFIKGDNEAIRKRLDALQAFIQSVESKIGFCFLSQEDVFHGPYGALTGLAETAWMRALNETEKTQAHLVIILAATLSSGFPKLAASLTQEVNRKRGSASELNAIGFWEMIIFPHRLRQGSHQEIGRFAEALKNGNKWERAVLILQHAPSWFSQEAKDLLIAKKGIKLNEMILDLMFRGLDGKKPLMEKAWANFEDLQRDFFRVFSDRLKRERRLEVYENVFKKANLAMKGLHKEWDFRRSEARKRDKTEQVLGSSRRQKTETANFKVEEVKFAGRRWAGVRPYEFDAYLFRKFAGGFLKDPETVRAVAAEMGLDPAVEGTIRYRISSRISDGRHRAVVRLEVSAESPRTSRRRVFALKLVIPYRGRDKLGKGKIERELEIGRKFHRVPFFQKHFSSHIHFKGFDIPETVRYRGPHGRGYFQLAIWKKGEFVYELVDRVMTREGLSRQAKRRLIQKFLLKVISIFLEGWDMLRLKGGGLVYGTNVTDILIHVSDRQVPMRKQIESAEISFVDPEGGEWVGGYLSVLEAIDGLLSNLEGLPAFTITSRQFLDVIFRALGPVKGRKFLARIENNSSLGSEETSLLFAKALEGNLRKRVKEFLVRNQVADLKKEGGQERTRSEVRGIKRDAPSAMRRLPADKAGDAKNIIRKVLKDPKLPLVKNSALGKVVRGSALFRRLRAQKEKEAVAKSIAAAIPFDEEIYESRFPVEQLIHEYSRPRALLLFNMEGRLEGYLHYELESRDSTRLNIIKTRKDRVRGRGTLLMNLFFKELVRRGIRTAEWDVIDPYGKSAKAVQFYRRFLKRNKIRYRFDKTLESFIVKVPSKFSPASRSEARSNKSDLDIPKGVDDSGLAVVRDAPSRQFQTVFYRHHSPLSSSQDTLAFDRFIRELAVRAAKERSEGTVSKSAGSSPSRAEVRMDSDRLSKEERLTDSEALRLFKELERLSKAIPVENILDRPVWIRASETSKPELLDGTKWLRAHQLRNLFIVLRTATQFHLEGRTRQLLGTFRERGYDKKQELLKGSALVSEVDERLDLLRLLSQVRIEKYREQFSEDSGSERKPILYPQLIPYAMVRAFDGKQPKQMTVETFRETISRIETLWTRVKAYLKEQRILETVLEHWNTISSRSEARELKFQPSDAPMGIQHKLTMLKEPRPTENQGNRLRSDEHRQKMKRGRGVFRIQDSSRNLSERRTDLSVFGGNNPSQRGFKEAFGTKRRPKRGGDHGVRGAGIDDGHVRFAPARRLSEPNSGQQSNNREVSIGWRLRIPDTSDLKGNVHRREYRTRQTDEGFQASSVFDGPWLKPALDLDRPPGRAGLQKQSTGLGTFSLTQGTPQMPNRNLAESSAGTTLSSESSFSSKTGLSVAHREDGVKSGSGPRSSPPSETLPHLDPKRIFVEFEEVRRNFSEAQIEEMLYLAEASGPDFRVVVSEVDVLDPLGKFFIKTASRLPNLAAERVGMEESVRRHTMEFSGEVIHLSGWNVGAGLPRPSSEGAETAPLQGFVETMSQTKIPFILIAHRGRKAGALAQGLVDIQKLLKNSEEWRPEYFGQDPKGRFYIRKKSESILQGWQRLYNQSVVFKRAA